MRKLTLLFVLSIGFFYQSLAQNKKTLKEEYVKEEATNPYNQPPKETQATDPTLLMGLLSQAKTKLARQEASTIFSKFEERGPFNCAGRASKVLIDDVHGIYLVGTSTGGLWSFVPDTVNYKLSKPTLPQLTKLNDYEVNLSISDIVQDPFDYQTIYYSTGEHRKTGVGIFKSTNGGKTFALLPNSSTTKISDFARIWFLSLHPTRANEMYIGTNRALYRSKDGGISYEKVFQTNFQSFESMTYNASGHLIVGIGDKGVYRSASGNPGSFVRLANGIFSDTTNGFVIKVANCASQPNILYAQFADAYSSNFIGIYKSVNGGDSWTKTADPKTVVSYNQSWHAFMLGVKPDNPNFVISGGVNHAFSRDGGATWNLSYNFLGVDFQHACWPAKDKKRVYLTSDHGFGFYECDNMDVYNITKAGTDMGENGLNTSQIYKGDFFPKGNGYLQGAQDNQVRLVKNKEVASDHLTGGDGFVCYVHQQDTMVGYASVQNGLIYRCDSLFPKGNPYVSNFSKSILNELDADKNGTVDEGHGFYTNFQVSHKNGDQIVYPTGKRIWRSTNKGNNWIPITMPFGTTNFSTGYMSLSDEANQTLYYGSDKYLFRINNVMSTVAGSETNISASMPEWVSIRSISTAYNQPNALYITNNYWSEPRIFKSINAKSANPTFKSISGDFPDMPINDLEVHPSDTNLLFVATDIGIFYSKNAGTNWQIASEFPNVGVEDLKFRASDKKLFIFTFGRGTWTAEVDPSVVGLEDDLLASARQSVVYPNPNKGMLYIQEIHTPTEVQIFDINGILVKQAKYFDGPLEVSELRRGAYVIKYVKENTRYYQTFIVE